MSRPLLDRFEQLLRQCKNDYPYTVDVVEMVGGGIRMPMIKQRVEKIFGMPGQMTMNGDDAVVRGCALRVSY